MPYIRQGFDGRCPTKLARISAAIIMGFGGAIAIILLLQQMLQ